MINKPVTTHGDRPSPTPGAANYFTPEWGVPGTLYMRCDRMSATLAVPACATNWLMAQDGGNASDRILASCRSCMIGASHAGRPSASQSPLHGASICARCFTGCTRMVRGYCISCYNREGELRRGFNRRGKPPTKLAAMHARALRVIEAGAARVMRRDMTADLSELMVIALRESKQTVMFAFNGQPSAQFGQAALW